ncbi:hypothetical protein AB1Y20_009663 [Prymnesium parvum]|uniref:Uncharacterized protein n=1 Tax=Prymnesium parvum TaxID=97485 RepID=A0AB34K4J5_PRYPA
MVSAVALARYAILLVVTGGGRATYVRDEFIVHSNEPLKHPPFTSEWMAQITSSNATLLEYMYPKDVAAAYERADIRTAWRPITRGCQIVPAGCYCFHVNGSPLKRSQPFKSLNEVHLRKANLWHKLPGSMEQLAADNCSCVAPASEGEDCLFGDMRPGKLLAIIATCRAAGVTHILEEGRYGGLSALVYALHGFKIILTNRRRKKYCVNAVVKTQDDI